MRGQLRATRLSGGTGVRRRIVPATSLDRLDFGSSQLAILVRACLSASDTSLVLVEPFELSIEQGPEQPRLGICTAAMRPCRPGIAFNAAADASRVSMKDMKSSAHDCVRASNDSGTTDSTTERTCGPRIHICVLVMRMTENFALGSSPIFKLTRSRDSSWVLAEKTASET